ncbi:tegument serine/threonine protein kinase [Equid alphaherpesvirus 3]|uniref:Tegument serine/threonine protein kinase n=1 Tax=Equid alphaherpesvirus 3 TaxID=80341 RepID=A0A077B9S0_9ALPH|nr:tegument serine/threonine protein kinase [Equid alphaherpesvirus 3]AIL02966.1 tegument serine/threonine protein kinase [Equid alphaherpesvirus 3]
MAQLGRRSSADEMDVGGGTSSGRRIHRGAAISDSTPLGRDRRAGSKDRWGQEPGPIHSPGESAGRNERRRRATPARRRLGSEARPASGESSSGPIGSRQSMAARCRAAARRLVGRTRARDPESAHQSGEPDVAGGHAASKRRRTVSLHRHSDHERPHLSRRNARRVARAGAGPLTQLPPPRATILKPKAVRRVFMPVFTVNPSMHYGRVRLLEAPKFGGAGSYGEVQLYRKTGIAVKTSASRSCFEHELAVTLLTGECSLRARASLDIGGIICLLAFSLPSKQMVFPAYDADLNAYGYRLARAHPLSPCVTNSIERAFIGLGRALVYLNTSCGLTHLDVKCGNIFVNHMNFVISDCVVGDLSLMTLNTNSMAMRAEFEIDIGDEEVRTLRLPRSASQMTFSLVVGHGHNQPLDVLADFINNSGLAKSSGPLRHDLGLAVDLYALGQALLELLLVGYLSPCLPVPVLRTATYYYYSNQLSADYALDVLAYRCALHPAVFPSTPLTTIYGIPWEQPDDVLGRLAESRHREAFKAHVERYRLTHRRLFASLRVPTTLSPVFELVALLCHANEKARLSIPLLWTHH